VTKRQFSRGIRLGFPILLGYAPVGVAFGVLAVTSGWTALQAVVCSATAIAGAGQFIGLSVVAGSGSLSAALVATTVVNLRYMLFASTISPYLHDLSPARQAPLAFTLTDETFAVNIADRRAGLSTPASMMGVGAIAWVGWVAGTAVGAYGAGWVGDPTKWGAQFAMPAMFTALCVALAENRRHVLVGVVAGVLALGLALISKTGVRIEASWLVVISAMVAATAGAVAFDE
jgi:4-azaleucine resistance transporter AzlC